MKLFELCSDIFLTIFVTSTLNITLRKESTLKVLSIHFMIHSKTFIKYLLSASTVHASDQVGDSREIYGPVLVELVT